MRDDSVPPPRSDDAPWGALQVGARVGAYELVRRLGGGGMGVVFEALHRELEKRVAVKTLHARVDDAAARRRFQREGRAAARVRHPHAVEVFDCGVCRGTPYLVMEFLDGEDLGSVLEREGAQPVAQIADVMLPVLAAVSLAHGEAIVHRDLKPDNIFLARAQRAAVQPKVLDFGIARLLDEDLGLTQSATLLGTPFYMSPEHAQNSRHAGVLSDQYSLGVILYECATGRLPFPQASLFELLEAIVRAPLPPPREVRPALPEAFESVILRAMHRNPAMRFASVHALGEALLPFASAGPRALWRPVFDPTLRVAALGFDDDELLVSDRAPTRECADPRPPPEPVAPTVTASAPPPRHEAVQTVVLPPIAAPRVAWGWRVLGVATFAALGVVASTQRAPDAPPPRVVLRPPPRDAGIAAPPPRTEPAPSTRDVAADARGAREPSAGRRAHGAIILR